MSKQGNEILSLFGQRWRKKERERERKRERDRQTDRHTEIERGEAQYMSGRKTRGEI